MSKSKVFHAIRSSWQHASIDAKVVAVIMCHSSASHQRLKLSQKLAAFQSNMLLQRCAKYNIRGIAAVGELPLVCVMYFIYGLTGMTAHQIACVVQSLSLVAILRWHQCSCADQLKHSAVIRQLGAVIRWRRELITVRALYSWTTQWQNARAALWTIFRVNVAAPFVSQCCDLVWQVLISARKSEVRACQVVTIARIPTKPSILDSG